MNTKIYNKELLLTATKFNFCSIGNYITYYVVKDGHVVIVMATKRIK